MELDLLTMFISIYLVLSISVLQINSLYFTEQPEFDENEKFDFIIVGAGPSGAVLANRLTEDPETKVLLLEAGGDTLFAVDWPFLAGYWQFTNYSWGYYTEPNERACLSCVGRKMWWPRGKALGGTSIINYMIAVRGNKLDYDRWAAMGNPGWSYGEVLPYFMKSEDANIEISDRDYHRQGGSLGVSDVPHRSDSSWAFVKAAQEAGYPYVDYNGKNQLGVSFVQSTTKNGHRNSADKAFLMPIRHRRNLKILTNSRAVQVLINPTTKTAYGVKFARNKRYYVATARKEVVLSAGSLNSPQLLMLSGIGPKQHLEELGIPVIYNSPVGQKMYDHLTFVGLIYHFNETIGLDLNEATREAPNFFFRRKGPLTSIGGVEALAYIKTSASDDPDPYPDCELIFVGAALNADDGNAFRRMFSVSQETYDAVYKPLEKGNVCQILPMTTHPKSYGYLKLKSKNPFHWPKFYPNYLSDPEDHDVKTFLAAIREAQRIMSIPSLQRYNTTLVRTPIPGCKTHVFDSDDYWICAVRHVAVTLWHQVATCKMGPSYDPEAVVDSNLRVYGIKNLRVADISVIPLPITAHTVLPAYMIGEKAADLLKDTWRHTENEIRSIDIRSVGSKKSVEKQYIID